MKNEYCIKYKNPENNKFELLNKCITSGSKLSREGLINYTLSNNTNSIFSVIKNKKNLPKVDLNVFDYYEEYLKNESLEQSSNLLYKLLIQNIKKQKIYDKTVILLSGGSDSILVACIIVELYGKDNVTAFTLDDGTSFMVQEVYRAKLAAKDLGIHHKIIKEKATLEMYRDIILKQGFSIDRSSFLYEKVADQIFKYFSTDKVDVFNGELNLLEFGFSISSLNDPTRYLRKLVYKNKFISKFLMIFEQFEYGSLKFKYFNSSNNKYLLTLNDIIRFLFEKKTELERITGLFNGKSKFPGYHGIDNINNYNFKEIFLNFFKSYKFNYSDSIERFLFISTPALYSGTTNIETITNIIDRKNMNMIHPFSSNELFALTLLTKYQNDKLLQKFLISKKYSINKKTTNFVKNHRNFNYYFSEIFESKSFLEFFRNKDYFEKLLNEKWLDEFNIRQINHLRKYGITNQRQFRLFVAAENLNNLRFED